MTRWFALLGATLALAALFGLAAPATSLTADEVDTLAAGAVFANALQPLEGAAAAGVEAAFAPVARHPRVKQLRGGAAYRQALVQAPLPRWVAGAAIAAAGSEERSDLRAARWGAAAALALAVALLGWAAAGRGGWPVAVTAAALMLCLPGVLEAGAGAGAQASAALASALLLVGVGRASVAGGGGGGVLAGVAWGLCLMSHPGGFFLLVPTLAAIAVGRRAGATPGAEDAPAPGELALPAVPPSVLAIPIIGAVVLVGAWPALWSDTGRGLATWFTEAWRTSAPAQTVAGVAFEQAADRAPQAWTALVQWVAWTPWPVLAAWAVGVVVTARRGARGWWFPLLAVVTLLLVGGADGGLWGARTSLLPLLWAPTAATATVGVVAVADWARPRLGWGRDAARLTAGLVAGALAAGAVLAAMSPLAEGHGAELRQPLPLALLARINERTPAARIAVIGGGTEDGWRRGFEVLWEQGGLKMHHRPPRQAQWLVVVDDPSVPAVRRAAPEIPHRAPELSEIAGGLTFEAFKVR